MSSEPHQELSAFSSETELSAPWMATNSSESHLVNRHDSHPPKKISNYARNALDSMSRAVDWFQKKTQKGTIEGDFEREVEFHRDDIESRDANDEERHEFWRRASPEPLSDRRVVPDYRINNVVSGEGFGGEAKIATASKEEREPAAESDRDMRVVSFDFTTSTTNSYSFDQQNSQDLSKGQGISLKDEMLAEIREQETLADNTAGDKPRADASMVNRPVPDVLERKNWLSHNIVSFDFTTASGENRSFEQVRASASGDNHDDFADEAPNDETEPQRPAEHIQAVNKNDNHVENNGCDTEPGLKVMFEDKSWFHHGINSFDLTSAPSDESRSFANEDFAIDRCFHRKAVQKSDMGSILDLTQDDRISEEDTVICSNLKPSSPSVQNRSGKELDDFNDEREDSADKKDDKEESPARVDVKSDGFWQSGDTAVKASIETGKIRKEIKGEGSCSMEEDYEAFFSNDLFWKKLMEGDAPRGNVTDSALNGSHSPATPAAPEIEDLSPSQGGSSSKSDTAIILTDLLKSDYENNGLRSKTDLSAMADEFCADIEEGGQIAEDDNSAGDESYFIESGKGESGNLAVESFKSFSFMLDEADTYPTFDIEESVTPKNPPVPQEFERRERNNELDAHKPSTPSSTGRSQTLRALFPTGKHFEYMSSDRTTASDYLDFEKCWNETPSLCDKMFPEKVRKCNFCRSKPFQILVWCVLIFLLVGLLAWGAIGVAEYRHGEQEPNRKIETVAPDDPATSLPATAVSTPAPSDPLASSVAPTNAPTNIPSTGTSFSLEVLDPVLPQVSRDSIRQRGTPQWRARDWLDSSPLTETLSVSRIRQRYAMAVFYYATEGENWTNQIRWLTDEDECTWYNGVGSCNADGELVEISIINNNLRGNLPPDLTMLLSLENLSLPFNSIGGSIPAGLGSLVRLTQLDLSFNELFGDIRLEPMPELEFCNLGSNSLVGSLPLNLGSRFPNLRHLLIPGNLITGDIPSSVGEMNDLEDLLLGNNRLEGIIPTEIGGCTELVTLVLEQNNLSGGVPSELALLPKLQTISIWQNDIVGSVPEDVCANPSLELLRVDCSKIDDCACCTCI